MLSKYSKTKIWVAVIPFMLDGSLPLATGNSKGTPELLHWLCNGTFSHVRCAAGLETLAAKKQPWHWTAAARIRQLGNVHFDFVHRPTSHVRS